MNGVNYYAQVFMFATPLEYKEYKTNCDSRQQFNFTSIFPTITSENDWICENDDKPNHIEMVFWSGNIVGFLIWGYTNDRFGRRPTVVVSHLVYILGNVTTFVATNFYSLMVCRFLVGAAHMTVSHLPYMLVLEYCEERARIIPLWTIMFSYSLSSILTPLLAMYLNSWRVLLAIATLPNLIVVVADLCQFIPESIRWLICKGKHSEAMNILLKIARWNKVRLNESDKTDMENTIKSLIKYEESEMSKDKDIMNVVLNHKRFFMRAFMTLILTFVAYTCYYGHVGNTSNIGNENIFLPFVYGATMEMGVVFSIPLLLNKIGRRCTLIFMLVAATIFSCMYAFWPKDLMEYNIIFAVLSRVCAAGSYYACLQFASEIFPTEIRGKGSSAFEISGGIGLFIQPQINYLAKSVHPSTPILIYGGLCMIAMVFGLLLPETADEVLPQTIEEANIFGTHQSCTHCIMCNPTASSSKSSQENITASIGGE